MPTILKVLAILTYIGAGLTFLMALGFIIGGSFITNFVSDFGGIEALGGVFLVGSGILLIGIGILQIFIARGYYKGQNWSRVITIVFSALGILGALVAILSGAFASIINLILNGLIFYYFVVDENCKKWFLS